MNPPHPPSFFITGTDTGVGKSFVSCALLHLLRARGLRAVGYKPVASGADLHADGQLVNEDAAALLAASSAGFSLRDINPVCLREATAPHLAARDEGVAIDLPRLVAGFTALRARADSVIVEGAGGLLVPLDEQQDFAMLAQALGLPVILVVGLRLGCINHALLTVEALAARGLQLAGWVANGGIDPAFSRAADNVATLRARIAAPLLGTLPRLTEAHDALSLLALPGELPG